MPFASSQHLPSQVSMEVPVVPGEAGARLIKFPKIGRQISGNFRAADTISIRKITSDPRTSE